jgi:uncharacterized membrane protein
MVRRISQTHAHTGVLIYVALAERYAELVPDSGISEHLGDAIWKPVIEQLTDSVKRERAVDGIVAAVETVAPSWRSTSRRRATTPMSCRTRSCCYEAGRIGSIKSDPDSISGAYMRLRVGAPRGMAAAY